MFFINNTASNPTINTNEKMNSALPYPPKVLTTTPTVKTAAPVNKRPMLKQNPVADARIRVGNNNGMYSDNIPWLAPKNNARIAISA